MNSTYKQLNTGIDIAVKVFMLDLHPYFTWIHMAEIIFRVKSIDFRLFNSKLK